MMSEDDGILSRRDLWCDAIYDAIVATPRNLCVDGGSDRGEFAYFGPVHQTDVHCISGRIEEGDTILEIEGHRVAGYTRNDILSLLSHSAQQGDGTVTIKAVRAGHLMNDLRQYLNTRFQKGSIDHDLQNTIRDNLYLRTVPCTTRSPKEGEVDGVDYTFLTMEEFAALERTGRLLESGIYEGNHYGTPKPMDAVTGNSNGALLPGAHPSSEGKRRRNRSNVEAMAAKSIGDSTHHNGGLVANGNRCSTMDTYGSVVTRDGLDVEPLPTYWEKPYKEDTYYNTQKLQRQDEQCGSFAGESDLPHGWERIDDPHYGTYYIDHVNRKTQYESPMASENRTAENSMMRPGHMLGKDTAEQQVEQQEQRLDAGGHFIRSPLSPSTNRESPSHPRNGMTPPSRHSPLFPCLPCLHDRRHHPSSSLEEEGAPLASPPGGESQYGRRRGDPPFSPPPAAGGSAPYRFTRNPAELQGTIIHASLVKGPRGFGFTIVGADEDSSEEFLQIKSIVPNGPAWTDGKLQTGDVLVHVNGSCVLGYTHQGVVNLFQSINPGEMVHLQVCRGYPLPFDLDDPNTEIVTTLAVTSLQDLHSSDYQDVYSGKELEMEPSNEENKARPTKSLPDLSMTRESSEQSQNTSEIHPQRHNSAILLGTTSQDLESVQLITTEIVKGNAGFGFTIADSAYGQKVKKILDGPRCGMLQEGDILAEINGCSVRGRLHSHVVQMLKDCPVGRMATLTIQRGPPVKPKIRSPKVSTDVMFPSQSSNVPHSAQKLSQPGVTTNAGGGYQRAYRSKTPTADLYSSQEKETVSRPKTPLVDTRHWDSVQSDRQDAVNPATGPAKPPRAGQLPHQEKNSHYGAWHHREQHEALEWNDTHSGGRLTHSYSAPQGPSRNSPNCYTNGSIYNQKTPSINTSQSPLGHLSEEWPREWIPDVHNSSWNYDYGLLSPRGPGQLSRLSSLSANHQLTSDLSTVNTGYCSIYSSPPSREQPSMYIQDGSGKHWTSFEHPAPSQQQHGHQEESVDLTVTIHRQESGFGFRIVGGTEEGSQVSIGHIVPGGAADVDGRLITGDEILSVDNHPVVNASHHHVVQLMGNAALHGCVTLGLRRKLCSTVDPRPSNSEVTYPYNVTVVRQENEGFGFVIISSVGKAGSTIGRIIEDSPAERCGQLHIGDRILAVNGVSILDMHHGEIVNLIKLSGLSAVLTIGAPIDDASSTASVSQRGEEMPPGVDEEYHSVELQRGVRGFGFSIRGGREFHNMPLFVLRIADQGPAQLSGKLQVGDQILEVNGTSTRNMTHADAIDIIRQGGNTVRLLVKRATNKGNKASPLVHVEGLPVLLQPHGGLCSGPLSQSSPRGHGTLHRDWYNWNIET